MVRPPEDQVQAKSAQQALQRLHHQNRCQRRISTLVDAITLRPSDHWRAQKKIGLPPIGT